MGRQLALAFVIAACHPQAAHDTPPAPVVRLPAPTASVVRDETPKAFREFAPVKMHVVGKATARKLPFHGASGVTVAPDGKTFFIDASQNGTPGGFVVSDAHPSGVFFATSEVHDARFSDDGKMLVVYNDERDVATVLGVPDGAALRDVMHVKQARFDGATLVTWDGCQLSRKGAPFGPKICGGADGSDDGRTWIVVTPERHGRPLSMRTYDELRWIDARSGVVKTIAEKVGEVSLSPKGDFVCTQSPRLWCYDFARGRAVDELPRLGTFRLVWDDAGARFVAATFHFDELVVVDFGARTVRHVSIDEDVRWIAMMPSGRLVVWEKGAWLVDPATGEAFELFPKTVEVGGLALVPGADDRFFMGNEVGSARDWYDVRVPIAANVSPTRQP